MINIYPNPADYDVDVFGTWGEICIYDTLGKLVMSSLLDGNEEKLDVSSLDEGVYLLRTKEDVGRLVISR